MPYHLRPGEPVSAGVRRIVREEIASAVRQLRGQGEADRDNAIHEARKNLKKIRGILRLMQPELGKVYRVENSRFRDAGRQLSHFRDAGAMLEVFDGLLKDSPLGSIRRGLMERKKEAEQTANIDEVLPRIAASLGRSARRVAAWPLEKDGFAAIEPGLEATFRRGRKALKLARKTACPENYHEWRKRVKEHWYHVRLLESYWSEAMESYEKSLKELETALGEDHNLVLLQQKVEVEPVFYAKPPDIALFVELIGNHHRDLRAKALDLGKHIYHAKPAGFTRQMRKLWDVRRTVSG